MEKLHYTPPITEVVFIAENNDIITASATLGFDGTPDYDNGAWT